MQHANCTVISLRGNEHGCPVLLSSRIGYFLPVSSSESDWGGKLIILADTGQRWNPRFNGKGMCKDMMSLGVSMLTSRVDMAAVK